MNKSCSNSQKGFGSVILIFILLSIVSSYMFSKFKMHDGVATDLEKLEYLEEVDNKMKKWVRDNISTLDNMELGKERDGNNFGVIKVDDEEREFSRFDNGNDCQSEVLFGLASVERRFNIQIALSDPILNFDKNIQGGQIAYRRLVYYISKDSDKGQEETCGYEGVELNKRMNKSNGDIKMQEGDMFKVISTEEIEVRKYIETLEKMRKIAYDFENRMFAKASADPMGSRYVNWFRATNCREATNGTTIQPMCTDSDNTKTGTIIATDSRLPDGFSMATGINNFLNFKDLYTFTQQDLYDAWGNPFYFCNSPECSNADTEPYTMTIASITPWSSKILFTAVQK